MPYHRVTAEVRRSFRRYPNLLKAYIARWVRPTQSVVSRSQRISWDSFLSQAKLQGAKSITINF